MLDDPHVLGKEGVEQTFLDVYRAVTSPAGVPTEAASMFGIFDWDKGKELRKSLIDAFTGSDWPPRDLALAVNDRMLFRKIFKRLYRKREGESYLRRMLSDLHGRPTPEAKQAAENLASLLGDPSFYEEWD